MLDTMTNRRRRLILLTLWALLLATVFHVYLFGITSGLKFDDFDNLRGLADVESLATALDFVFSGEAGPTGRPLALASFLIHAESWPENTSQVLLTNILIHLLNGLLVGLLAFLLAKHSPTLTPKQRAPWVALAAAAIWMALPLLASSSLFIIQRMATLATLLVLLGLSLHVLGRSMLTAQRHAGLVFTTLGVLLGLGLGVLSKENAAVYPLLALVLDRTLLHRLPRDKPYRVWRLVFLYIPAALLAAYMLQRLELSTVHDARHFSQGDRILTQAVILFDYLRLMLFPNLSLIGPFHDHYPIYGGLPKPIALAAVVGWCAAAVAAIIFGPRWPIPAFGILWFLAAHSLESTWIMLELYFEHRNYLPAVGVILALALGLSQLSTKRPALAYAGLGLYWVVLLTFLIQVTILWGVPRISAEVWLANNPTSARTVLFAASYREAAGRYAEAAEIADRISSLDRRSLGTQLYSLRMHCILGNEEGARTRLDAVMDRIPDAHYVHAHPGNDARGIERILESIVSGQCTALGYDDIDAMAALFLTNPIVERRPHERYNYYILRSRAADAQGDNEGRLEFIVTALEQSPVLETAEVAARMATEERREDLLLRILSVLEREKPSHPVHRRQWQEVVDAVSAALNRPQHGVSKPDLHFERPVLERISYINPPNSREGHRRLFSSDFR